MKSVFFVFGGGVSVCVNADRTGPLAPPFFTNGCHVENYYTCVTTDMQPECEVENCFFVFYFYFFWGVSVCVNADRTGPLASPFFTNECIVENYYTCVTTDMQPKHEVEKCFFFFFFFFFGCQCVLMQTGLGHWHPLFSQMSVMWKITITVDV